MTQRFNPATSVVEAKKLSHAQQEQIYPSQWTSTQPGEKYMVHAKDDQPALVLGQRTTAVVRDGSHEVEVSIPHLPYEKWIKRCGTVALVPTHTTRVTEHGIPVGGNKYRDEARREMLRSGAVSYDRGPTAEQWAAMTSDAPRPYPTAEQWAAMREDYIKERADGQSAEMAEADARHMDGKKARQAELQKEIVETFSAIQENLTAAAARRAEAAATEGKGKGR